jgi:hypothetical protein
MTIMNNSKVCYLKYYDTAKEQFLSQYVRRFCTNAIKGHCPAFGHACTNMIQGHCSATTSSNNDHPVMQVVHCRGNKAADRQTHRHEVFLAQSTQR